MKFQSRAGVRVLSLLLASGFLFVCYAPIASARPQPEGPTVAGEAEQALFTKGQTLYTQGLYSEAIMVFSEFLKSYPYSLIKDLNLLWLGRSYLRAGDIAGAERMGLRLREIADTPFAGMFEEELRIARQGYVKSAAPAVARKNDVATSGAARQVISADRGALSEGDNPKSPSSPSMLGRPTISIMSSPLLAVDTRQSGARNATLPGLSAKIRPFHSTPNKVVSRPQKEPTAGAAPTLGTAVAPLLRIRIEELPRVAAANGVVFYRLVVVNEGKGAARDLILREELHSAMDFASSDPAPGRQEIVAQALVLTFRLPSLEPGASRSIRIAVRPRPDAKPKPATVNTAAQIKQSATYRDSKGNPYHTP